ALVRQPEAGRDQLEDLLEQVGAGLEELRPLAAGDGQIGPQLENWTSSVRDALDTLEQVGRDMEQLLSTSSDLFASIADAVSDAGSAFREGMSSILDALEGTGTAGSDLEDAAGQLQQAGGMLQEVLSQAMEDFTGSSNLLEIDTDAQKRSFTSAENAAPESVQAVLRTAPIGFSMTQDQEDKPQEAQTPWQRVLLVFERMKEAVSVLFTKE
ncbi:MAG: hypothetical protein LIO46_01485, partial [Clostridiales bacterium]|nr:hypothetical protein [Clostridiales bacterium]